MRALHETFPVMGENIAAVHSTYFHNAPEQAVFYNKNFREIRALRPFFRPFPSCAV